MKNIEFRTFWDMKDGRKYVGILDDVDWEKGEFSIINGTEVSYKEMPGHKIRRIFNPDYLNEVILRDKAVSSYYRKKFENIPIRDIRKAIILKN